MRLLALDAEGVGSVVGEAATGGSIVITIAYSCLTEQSEEMKIW